MPQRPSAQYDLVVKGGRILDPGQRLDRKADLAINGDSIVAIQPDIDNSHARDVIDARGKLVTPGLIDLHAHVGAPDLTPAALLRDGVTSMVDGGSAGADIIDELVKLAQSAPNGVRMFLRTAGTGVPRPGDRLDIAAADVAAARAAIARHRDW